MSRFDCFECVEFLGIDDKLVYAYSGDVVTTFWVSSFGDGINQPFLFELDGRRYYVV